VRKLSGYHTPSRANAKAFERAVSEVAASSRRLVDALVTSAPARDRELAAAQARARAVKRYGGLDPERQRGETKRSRHEGAS
jgi:hypothetical protein